MTQLKVGDKVKWASQAGGCTKKKVGSIVAIVPVGGDVIRYVPYGMRMKSGPVGKPRKHESYLVQPVGYGTEVLWPLASKLQLVLERVGVDYAESNHQVASTETAKASKVAEYGTAKVAIVETSPKASVEPSSQDGCTC